MFTPSRQACDSLECVCVVSMGMGVYVHVYVRMSACEYVCMSSQRGIVGCLTIVCILA